MPNDGPDRRRAPDPPRRSLGGLHSCTRRTMPQSSPGVPPEEGHVAIVPPMPATTGAQAGEEPLPTGIRSLGRLPTGPEP